MSKGKGNKSDAYTGDVKTRRNKAKVLKALEDQESGAFVSLACRKAGIHRKTFYEWLKADDLFSERYTDIRERVTDSIESNLCSMIFDAERDSDRIRASEIYLKAHAKDRGYGVEKRENEMSGELEVKATIEDVRFEIPDNGTSEGSESPKPPGWETATGGQ